METPQAPQVQFKKVICPIVTVWSLFFVNLMIFSNTRLLYEFSYYRLRGFWSLFFLFIIIGLLAIGIVITLSIERRKYRLYFIGFIMSIIFEAIVTIGLIILFFDDKLKYWYFYLILLLIEWSLFIVLLSYKKTVLENSQISEINQGIDILRQGNENLVQI